MVKKFRKLSDSLLKAIKIKQQGIREFPTKPSKKADLMFKQAVERLRPQWDSLPAELENLPGRIKNLRTKHFKVLLKSKSELGTTKATLISSSKIHQKNIKKRRTLPFLNFLPKKKNPKSIPYILKELDKLFNLINSYSPNNPTMAEELLIYYESDKKSLISKLIHHLKLITDQKHLDTEKMSELLKLDDLYTEMFQLLSHLDRIKKSEVISTDTIQQTKSNSRYAIVKFSYVAYPFYNDTQTETVSMDDLDIIKNLNCFMGMIKYVHHLEYKTDQNQIPLLPVSNFSCEEIEMSFDDNLNDLNDLNQNRVVHHLSINDLAQEGLKKQIELDSDLLIKKHEKDPLLIKRMKCKTSQDIDELNKHKDVDIHLKLLSCFKELEPWVSFSSSNGKNKQFQSPIIMLELSDDDLQKIIEENNNEYKYNSDKYIPDLEYLIRKKEYFNSKEASQIYPLVEKNLLVQLIDELSTKNNAFTYEKINLDSLSHILGNNYGNHSNQKVSDTDHLAIKAQNHITSIINDMQKNNIVETNTSSMSVFVHDGASNIFYKLISILKERFKLEKNESEFQFIDNIILNSSKKMIYHFTAHFCHVKIVYSHEEPSKIMSLKEACKKLIDKEIIEIQICYHKVNFKDAYSILGIELEDFVNKTSIHPENKFYFDSFYNTIDLYTLAMKEKSKKIMNLLYSKDKHLHEISINKLSNYLKNQNINSDKKSKIDHSNLSEEYIYFQKYLDNLSIDKNTYLELMKKKFNLSEEEGNNFDRHINELFSFHQKYPLVLKSRNERMKEELSYSKGSTKFEIYNPLGYFQYEETFFHQRDISHLIKSSSTVTLLNLHELKLKYMLIQLSHSIFFSHILTSHFWNIHLQNVFTVPHLSKKIFLSQFFNPYFFDSNGEPQQKFIVERQPICHSLSSLKYFIERLYCTMDEKESHYDNEYMFHPVTGPICDYLEDIEHWTSAIKDSFYQGHSEIYSVRCQRGYYYDCNSLYPFIMSSKEMPVGIPQKWKGEALENCFGFLRAKIKMNRPFVNSKSHFFIQHTPILPYKMSNTNSSNYSSGDLKDSLQNNQLTKIQEPFDITIYPVGEFSGWYFSEELKYAKQCGYEIMIEDGYLYQRAKLFTDFIHQFFKLKHIDFQDFQFLFLQHHGLLKSNINLNFFKEELYYLFILIKNHTKLMMNSLYGKVSQHIKYPGSTIGYLNLEKENSTLYPYLVKRHEFLVNEKYDKLLQEIINSESDAKPLFSNYEGEKEIDTILKHSLTFQNGSNLSIGAAITSYGRIYMHQNFLTNPEFHAEHVKYMDTDCVITDKPIPSSLVHSTELGKFKNVIKEHWSSKIPEECQKSFHTTPDDHFYYTNFECTSIRNYTMISHYQSMSVSNEIYQDYYVKSYLGPLNSKDSKKYFELIHKCNQHLFHSDNSYVSKILNWKIKYLSTPLYLLNYYLNDQKDLASMENTSPISCKFHCWRYVSDPKTINRQLLHLPVSIIPMYLKLQVGIIKWLCFQHIQKSSSDHSTNSEYYDQFFANHIIINIKKDLEGKKICYSNPLFDHFTEKGSSILKDISSKLGRLVILSNQHPFFSKHIGKTFPFRVVEENNENDDNE